MARSGAMQSTTLSVRRSSKDDCSNNLVGFASKCSDAQLRRRGPRENKCSCLTLTHQAVQLSQIRHMPKNKKLTGVVRCDEIQPDITRIDLQLGPEGHLRIQLESSLQILCPVLRNLTTHDDYSDATCKLWQRLGSLGLKRV